MASDCEARWLSIRKRQSAQTELVHVDVTDDGSGKLKGKKVETGKDLTGRCIVGGMTWTQPDSGSPELIYVGKFDGDQFPPGTYKHKEDHITGTCTVVNKISGYAMPLDDEEVWTGEKVT